MILKVIWLWYNALAFLFVCLFFMSHLNCTVWYYQEIITAKLKGCSSQEMYPHIRILWPTWKDLIICHYTQSWGNHGQSIVLLNTHLHTLIPEFLFYNLRRILSRGTSLSLKNWFSAPGSWQVCFCMLFNVCFRMQLRDLFSTFSSSHTPPHCYTPSTGFIYLPASNLKHWWLPTKPNWSKFSQIL